MVGLLLRALAGLLSYFRFAFTSFWGWLATFIFALLPQMMGFILKLFGIGLVSYLGFNFFIDSLSSYLMNKFDGLPSDLLQILLLMKLDIGMSMMFAAMSVAITIKVTTQSAKVVWNKPSNIPGGMEA